MLDNTWPGQRTVRHLIQQAHGIFMWAATAYRFMEGDSLRRRDSTTTAALKEHLK
jgi:hypothetical protein